MKPSQEDFGDAVTVEDELERISNQGPSLADITAMATPVLEVDEDEDDDEMEEDE